MDLLDATLAFALTLAALATIVTIIQEIAVRFLGLRRKDQVRLIQQLVTPSTPKPNDGSAENMAEASWPLVTAILQNPFSKANMGENSGSQRYLGWRGKAIYERVSLEHVLRKFAQLEDSQGEDLRSELYRISLRYEELSSALSADFKRNAQRWTVILGIALAFVCNIDGVRVFKVYLKNPELAAEAIKQLTPEAAESPSTPTDPAKVAQDPKQPKDEVQELRDKVDSLEENVKVLSDLSLPVGSDYYPLCGYPWSTSIVHGIDRNVGFFKLENHSSIATFFSLKKAGAETGPVDERCKDNNTEPNEDGPKLDPHFTPWFFSVLVTGLLIGLGAPFWYDVAARLSQVRRALGGTGNAEQRHSGVDSVETTEERVKLVDRIVQEVDGQVPDTNDAKSPDTNNGKSPATSTGKSE